MLKDCCDVYEAACHLYDGGWRSGDKAELIREYELEEDEAEALCEYLEKIEKESK